MLSTIGSIAGQAKRPKIYLPFDVDMSDVINGNVLTVQSNTLTGPFLYSVNPGYGFSKALGVSKVGYGESPDTGACIQSLAIPSNVFNKDFGMRFILNQSTYDMVDNLKIITLSLYLSASPTYKQYPLLYARSDRSMITVGPDTIRNEVSIGGTTILNQQPGEGTGGPLWFTINRIGNVLYAYMNGKLLGQVTLDSYLITGYSAASYLVFESYIQVGYYNLYQFIDDFVVTNYPLKGTEIPTKSFM